MFNFSKNSSKSSITSTTPLVQSQSSVDSIFDSSNPKSPLYSPNYQIPIPSLSESISILKGNSGEVGSKTKKEKKESTKPISFDSSNPSSPLYSPNYQIPIHSITDSVAILKRNSPPSPRSSSSKKNDQTRTSFDSSYTQPPTYSSNDHSSAYDLNLDSTVDVLRGFAGAKV